MSPVSNPHASYAAHRDEIDAAIARVLASGRYILGQEVEAFEQEFAAWHGPDRYAVGCGSGTDALVLAMRALGIGPGHGVIVPAFGPVATAMAVRMVGAEPVFVDVEPQDLTLSPRALDFALSRRFRPRDLTVTTVIAVHLFGAVCDLSSIVELCRVRGVMLIEDCAQATGAAWEGQKVGGFGHAAAFSFYPTKNLSCLGDGGAVMTRDPEVAAAVRRIRQYGWDENRFCRENGINSRLDEVQAAVLRVKLKALGGDLDRRREIQDAYRQSAIGRVRVPGRATVAPHLAVVKFDDSTARTKAMRRFADAGVGTGIHYPVLPCGIGGVPDPITAERVPVAEAARHTVLSLPLWPEMTDDQVDRVCEVLREL